MSPLYSNGSTKRAGYAFVTSNHYVFTYGDADANKLYEMTENLYIKGILTQTKNLVISGGRPKITVYDDKDDVIEDVSRELNIMFSQPACDIECVARAGMDDMLVWGTSIWNHVWERKANKLTCLELTRLYPYTFADAPNGVNNQGKVFGHVLQGIYYDTIDRTTHYCQKSFNGGSPVEIQSQNLFIMKDESCNYPDGNSILYCVIPIASFQDYCWNTLYQQLFRTGAPIMFITIDNPQPGRVLPNGDEYLGDIEYAELVLENWGKDTPYVLRENMKISTINVREGSLAISTLNKASETLRDYMSPVGMLGRDGTLISGNSDASLKLINNYIRGWISLLENNLRRLPNYYLKYNHYPDTWHAEVEIPTTTIDDINMKINLANTLYSTKTGTVNEVRELLGYEGVSDEELRDMRDGWNPDIYDYDIFYSKKNSTEPDKSSYRKRMEIASRAEAEINENTDKLFRNAISVMKKCAKK